MNTNALKRFAKEARIKLLDIVGRKLEYVLENKSVSFIATNATQLDSLRKQIQLHSQQQVIETVAYTWFNRLMALRFMDANGYTNPKVLTPAQGSTVPEILQEAKAGNIDAQLTIDTKRLNELLDGKATVADAQTEAYKLLLIASCNYWNTALPFMFERISDYTELLLPDDLLSDFSIIADLRNGMTDDDCQQEEILGWLYQFYISDENERLIKSKSVYKKHELAPASQLFTPKWIVRYMVDNTLGQLWSEINPATTILNKLEFYIKPSYLAQLKQRPKKNIEEIKFFEPCAGSAHILAYAFDVYYLMYEEQGYNTSEIPELIIKHNLFGIDIDERAAQIASFVLMMKGRRKNSRFLKKNIKPNITFYEDFEGDSKFKNCKALGSLINVEPADIDEITIEEGSVFAESQHKLKKLYTFLGQRYDCVVTNPPYISSSRMEGSVKQFVETNYPDTKSDLFATFVIRCLELCNEDGLTGYMTPFVWMFILSYQKLRENIIENHFINNLIQLEYSGFDGATVPVCTFTLRNNGISNANGSYIRLSEFRGPEKQAPKTLEAIQNQNCGWFYLFNQNLFIKIPGQTISYWASEKSINVFSTNKLLFEEYTYRSGVMTGDDNYFIKFWYEVNYNKIGFNYNNNDQMENGNHIFFPLNKEEGYRKWDGRYKSVLFYKNGGRNFEDYPNLNFRLRDKQFYFKKGISWGDVTSSLTSYRYQEEGLIFAARAPMIFTENKILCAILNSKIVAYYQQIINPTLSFNLVDLEKIPVAQIDSISYPSIESVVDENIKTTKDDWLKNELSWDFQENQLIEKKQPLVKATFDLYNLFWSEKFYNLHQNEEELNRQFIEIYGLGDELTPDVPLEEITILQEESKIIDGDLFIEPIPVLLQLLSYSIGCMYGRYSLSKPGLILANQGETLQDYLKQVPNSTFMPDEDNIIPFLEGEYFTDDIVGRFKEFLKVSFGEEHFEENLRFIEETIGKDIRKYFVKDFYNDHIKRYKKRPIYWMFSSPKGSFKALIYMHRYRSDTVSKLLNDYLRTYISKLESEKQSSTQATISESASARERNLATRRITEIESILNELKDYERILFEVATQKIEIDLDDGVKVNYQKFKNALVPIKGLEKEEE